MNNIDKQSRYFADTLKLSMDNFQLLKYNLQAFKECELHKLASEDMDMREDVAKLQRAMVAFQARLRMKCKGPTFAGIIKDMEKDRLHDLSLHMQFMDGVDNVAEITALFRKIMAETTAESQAKIIDELKIEAA